MLDIARRYVEAIGDEDLAIVRFARDLMMGDPGTLKQGYSQPNAVLATAEAFDVPRARVEDLLA